MKLKIILLFIYFIYVPCHAQVLNGSFESKYKRYAKGEQFAGNVSLSQNLDGWKGERLYTQLVLWSSNGINNLTYEVTDFINGSDVISSSQVQLMFARNVKSDPDPRSCGTFPQPRLELSEVADALSFDEVNNVQENDPLKVWIRINIPSSAHSGTYLGTIKVKQNQVELLRFSLVLNVLEKTLPTVDEWQFHLDLWQYPYQVLKHYNQNHPNSQIQLWSDAHFAMFLPFYQLLADVGQKVVTAHIKEGAQGQPSMISWIKKINGSWDYDFTAFDKYVYEMDTLGISKQISCFSPAGWDDVKDYIPYYDEATNTNKNLSAPLASAEFNTRWDHFLTAFKTHLNTKGWFDKTVLYLDEIDEALLQDVIDMILDNDPDWKIGLTYFHPLSTVIDNVVYDLSGILGTSVIGDRSTKISTFYTSCSQTIPNNYVSPLNSPAEMTWMSWHVLNQGVDGYLRWAYDFWTLNDPMDIRDGGHTSGDYAMVYRSSNEQNVEVYSSYRLELLRKGIQDYEKTRLLKAELESSTDSYDREVLVLLNSKVGEFHKESGEGAVVLVEQAEELLNNIVKGTATYCKIKGASTSSAYTQWFSVMGSSTTIGNTWEEAYPGGYSRYQGGTVSGIPGDSLTFTVENSSGANCARTTVWIDWNGDLDFDDAGEEVFNAGTANSCANATTNTFSISVPNDAKVGLTRIRIQVRDAFVAEPISCGSRTHASTRDFDMEILDTYCAAPTSYNTLYFVKSAETDSCAGNMDIKNTVVPLNGFTFYEVSNAIMERGTTFELNIKNSTSSVCARTGVWIDWNNDGDFNDMEEEIKILGNANSCSNSLDYSILINVPLTAVTGDTRMRIQVRDSYQDLPESCLVDGVSGTTDITVQITDSSTNGCSPILITPREGHQLNSTSESFVWSPNNLSISSWKLKVSHADSSKDRGYFEQIFPPSTTSTQISTLPTLGEPLTVELFWEVNGEWYSKKTFNTAKDLYCQVSGGNNKSYYIQSLNTTKAEVNVNYLTPNAPIGGYTYVAEQHITAKEGSSFTVALTPSAASNCARMKVWVDWNGDHDFDDTGEEVYASGTAQSCQNPYTYQFNIKVPYNVSGQKRMRIQLRDAYESEPVSCGVHDFTGTADFDIEVIEVNKAVPDYYSDVETSSDFWSLYSKTPEGSAEIKQAWGVSFPNKVISLGHLGLVDESQIVRADFHTDLRDLSNDIILNLNHAAYGNEGAYGIPIPSETGIFLSDDNGQTFTKVSQNFIFGINFHTAVINLNITQLAAQYGLNLSANFIIRFQHKVKEEFPQGVELWNVGLYTANLSSKSNLIKSTISEGNGVIKVYPNPTKGITTLHFTSEFDYQREVVIHIYDVTGKKLRTIYHYSSFKKDGNTVELDLYDVPNGMYIVSIIGENIKTSKLIWIQK